jgi:carboxymethylenebutenolidase
MCDEKSLQDAEQYLRRNATQLSRREFGAMVIGAGVIASLPRAANALDVTGTMVAVETADGSCEAYFACPSHGGPHPAVLMWPDAFGLREAFRQMARRLAESGYVVLVPNPYYRSARVPVLPEPIDMKDPKIRELWAVWRAPLTAEAVARDATAHAHFLDSQTIVDRSRKMAAMGYCMGGAMTLRTAAALPERIGAAASFHGAGLVTDQPDSPHLLVPKMKASFLACIAESDDQRQPDAKDVLRKSFDAAGLKAEIEVYPGTQHGWCPPDTPVYNEIQAERAWGRMLALFSQALT